MYATHVCSCTQCRHHVGKISPTLADPIASVGRSWTSVLRSFSAWQTLCEKPRLRSNIDRSSPAFNDDSRHVGSLEYPLPVPAFASNTAALVSTHHAFINKHACINASPIFYSLAQDPGVHSRIMRISDVWWIRSLSLLLSSIDCTSKTPRITHLLRFHQSNHHNRRQHARVQVPLISQSLLQRLRTALISLALGQSLVSWRVRRAKSTVTRSEGAYMNKLHRKWMTRTYCIPVRSGKGASA
jgi:hypothetical protein